MSIDSMYELAALGELLEQKGVMTKEEIIALAKELKRKTPPTDPPTATTTDTPPHSSPASKKWGFESEADKISDGNFGKSV
jgi:hypothetical protein